MKLWLPTLWLASMLSIVNADEPQKIAGRELPHYQAQLESDNRVVRLTAAKTLGAFGEAAGPALITALTHQDPGVRYTAAVHLGRIGGEHLKKANGALLKMRSDASSLAGQQAAAFALCRAGSIDGHLSLLIERLAYPERAMACSAAELLGMIGGPAAPALQTLEKVKQDNPASGKGDYHLGAAAGHAIDKIQSETK